MRLLPSVAAAALLLLCTSAVADPITYTVNENFPAFTAQGTITTDGTLGTLSASHILDYDLTVSIPPISSSFTEGGNFITQVTGTDLSATSAGLFFDFSGAPGNFLLGSPTDQTYLCFNTGGSCNGDSTTGVQASISGIVADSPTQSGLQQIAVAADSMPEPSSIALLGSGLLGLIMRKRFT